MTIKSGLLCLGLAALLPACASQARENPGPAGPVDQTGKVDQTGRADQAGGALSVHPESGLDVVPLAVTQGERVHRFRVEVARTPDEQAMGLMFRTALGPDEGMLFPRRIPGQAHFWMKNTVIPLDIIFIGADGRISNIEANAEPHSLDARSSVGAASAVLELRGGRAAELGIAAGARVEW